MFLFTHRFLYKKTTTLYTFFGQIILYVNLFYNLIYAIFIFHTYNTSLF